jgi:hypothetical protein
MRLETLQHPLNGDSLLPEDDENELGTHSTEGMDTSSKFEGSALHFCTSQYSIAAVGEQLAYLPN